MERLLLTLVIIVAIFGLWFIGAPLFIALWQWIMVCLPF